MQKKSFDADDAGKKTEGGQIGGSSTASLSVVVPCFNEHASIEKTVRDLDAILDGHTEFEIIVVDDGSTDGSEAKLVELLGTNVRLRVYHHEQNQGYGAALKTGIRQAKGDFIAITDADGTYPNARIIDLLTECAGADMVVGSRTGENVEYSWIRTIPKYFLKAYCSWIVRAPIPDMNSGLRVIRRGVVLNFLKVLPDSFSFTTSITIAMMTNSYTVRYVPIDYSKRTGRSKISPIKDTLRFIQLIFRTGLYFVPLRVLTPLIYLAWAAWIGLMAYDTFVIGNITDKTITVLLLAINITMLALIADMIDKRTPR